MAKIILLGLFIVLVFNVFGYAEDGPSSGPSVTEILGDVLWIRPLGVVRMILEAVAFVISLPVTASLKEVDAASEFMIKDPYAFVFERPLGEM